MDVDGKGITRAQQLFTAVAFEPACLHVPKYSSDFARVLNEVI